MFNGQILRQLIADAGLTKKEFEKQMFGSKSTDLYHWRKQRISVVILLSVCVMF